MHLNDVTGPAVSSAERDLRSAPTSYGECARFCGSRTFEAGFEENKGRPLDAIAWRMYNGLIMCGRNTELSENKMRYMEEKHV
jgi:hypothetical protein